MEVMKEIGLGNYIVTYLKDIGLGTLLIDFVEMIGLLVALESYAMVITGRVIMMFPFGTNNFIEESAVIPGVRPTSGKSKLDAEKGRLGHRMKL